MAAKKIPPTLAAFPTLPGDALIDVKLVAILFGCSENTVWRRSRSGVLPVPIRVSPQQTRWRVGDVRCALAAVGGSSEAAA